jgi:alanyl aminopeptidase
LPRTVVPSLVQLELKLDPRQANFTGTTRIQAKVSETTDTIWMHGQGLKISKAEAVLKGGKRIALTPSEADVSGVLKMAAAQPVPAGDVTLEIAYEAPFGELQGAYRVKPDGKDYVITQMEPLGARHTFPSFDEPSFKAALGHHADRARRRNRGRQHQRGQDRNAARRLEEGHLQPHRSAPELSRRLCRRSVGPAAGPGHRRQRQPYHARSSCVASRAKGQGARMKYSLENTPVIVKALEDYFATPYPFDKLDNVAGAGLLGGRRWRTRA